MISTLLNQQPINNTKITKNKSSEKEPEPTYDLTTISVEPSDMKSPPSQENGYVVEKSKGIDIQRLDREQKDLCNHCAGFKDLSFAVCPNCGNALNIPSDACD
jgi:hypothetical protein